MCRPRCLSLGCCWNPSLGFPVCFTPTRKLRENKLISGTFLGKCSILLRFYLLQRTGKSHFVVTNDAELGNNGLVLKSQVNSSFRFS